MGSQQFCLKWKNHQGNLIEVFDELLEHGSFVDVTLACQGVSLKVHKVVLSACSPFFKELFQQNPCKHPIVFMNDVDVLDLKAIIKFMYKGEIDISQDQLPNLLKVADSLKVKGLAEVQVDKTTNENDLQLSPTPKRKRTNSGSSQAKPQATKQLNLEKQVSDLKQRKEESIPKNSTKDDQSNDLPNTKDQNDEQNENSTNDVLQQLKCSPATSPEHSPDSDNASPCVDPNQFLLQQFSCSDAAPSSKTEERSSCSNMPSQSVFPANIRMPDTGNVTMTAHQTTPANAPFIESQDFLSQLDLMHTQQQTSIPSVSTSSINFDSLPTLDGAVPTIAEKPWRSRGRPASWSPETLQLAMTAVLKNGWSVTAAAKNFGIPQPTLHSYISKFYKRHIANLTSSMIPQASKLPNAVHQSKSTGVTLVPIPQSASPQSQTENHSPVNSNADSSSNQT